MALVSNLNKTHNGYQEFNKKPSIFNIQLILTCLSLFFVVAGLYWICIKDSQNQVHLALKLPQTSLKSFPPGFYIGCATSSYQIEGAWNTDGKGENIWDRLVHQTDSVIKNSDTGDVACDSYHKYKEDVQLVKDIGFTHYRFSLSWSRVLPSGHDDHINKLGIDYYHNIIDELLANGIEPMVTLYHWDLPQPLQDLGGWANPLMANYFENYVRVIFKELGSKVKWWITINEPRNVLHGYGGMLAGLAFAPSIYQPGVADYLVAHTLLRAHAKAYRLYDKEFRPLFGGKISISLDARYFLPLTDSEEDKMACMRAAAFEIGLFAHPIFSNDGDYPSIVRELVDQNSRKEGRSISRLPKFNEEEIKEIRGSFDFFGLNHYTSSFVTSGYNDDGLVLRDSGVVLSDDPSWPSAQSPWLKVVPWGMRGVLNYIRTTYKNPPVFITENGYSSDKVFEDHQRIKFFNDYLEQMLLAIHLDNCSVIGYTAWSLMDNFEWAMGYTEKFGIHYVNFSHPARPRRKKMSASYFKNLLKTRTLPNLEKLGNNADM